MALAKLEAKSRADCKIVALAWIRTQIPTTGAGSEWKPLLPSALVQCTIYAKDPSWVMDGDNALALCKTLFDGLTDAGIFTTDRRLVHWPVLQPVDKAKAGQVLVIIKPRPGWVLEGIPCQPNP